MAFIPIVQMRKLSHREAEPKNNHGKLSLSLSPAGKVEMLPMLPVLPDCLLFQVLPSIKKKMLVLARAKVLRTEKVLHTLRVNKNEKHVNMQHCIFSS